ncbi:Crp/Fnr family transcriptional regulator [Dehalobacter sp.]|uniref:Crp/Fnr family transcriptional regulator n=1 Tax=Dehalobacter sp. TaxID=1962289 RepID=UPI002583E115|nr:Crp/Fnr family transcriptional regulator [Dehalobacter sp.]MDJ0304758.1 Crp/Fnr family transcriptional regulator [Dehalobacter sp.]
MFIIVKYWDSINESTLLSTLPTEEIQKLLENGQFRIVCYKKDSIIHFDGEVCSKLEIILSGKIVIERIDESGNTLTISDFYSDDILGGNLIFSTNPRYPMTAISKLPSVILEINKELLFSLFSTNPLFLSTFLEFISDHASILSDKIKHYINRTIRESIINYLKYEQKKQKACKIILPTSKKSLAEKIGVQRTSLSRELQKMKNEKLIDFDFKSITILNL